MSTITPFNLTIVLPPNRQYYVSYFYPYEFHNNSRYQCKYRSNVTTALEEGWHSADVYNEFWKDNPTRGEPITGNIYKVPFIFNGNIFQFKACTYFVFSYYENDELKYFVYVMNENGAHTGSFSYSDTDIETYLKKDTDGSLLVYVGFITDYGTQVYAPGRKIGNYTLGINDVLLRGAAVDKCAEIGNNSQHGALNNFPDEVLVNGYYIFTSTEGVIDGEYQLVDGYNIGTKVPELTTGVLKQGLTLNWCPYANHIGLGTYNEDAYAYVYRFKFTKTNDSDPNRTQYRIMHFNLTGDYTGNLNSFGDLWIDPETKELKIWSWMINPEIRVLKQLPNDALDAWHELVIPRETYGDLKDFYFDGEYFDLVEICGRILPASFRHNIVAGFSDIDGRLNYVAKDKSKILDYAAIHLYSEFRPYVMKDNYFDYYEPILPDVPEPEPEEPTGVINKNIYLVCYKGATSIFDKLIRIIKTNLTSKEFPPPPIDPKLRHLVGRLPPPLKGTFIPPLAKPEHILNVLPKSYPIHMSPRPIEVLLSKILNSDYTHVGLWVVPENMPIPKEITYYACREDAGVMEYTEAYTDVDLYKIKMPTVKPYHVEKFFEKTQYKRGSMIGDMGYRHLMHEHSMSSVEWVAAALNLAFPCKYTINKLIDFANLEE